MTLNGVMALILRYFTEFSSFRGARHKSGWRCRRKKFTFGVSSPDEFRVQTVAQNRINHKKVILRTVTSPECQCARKERMCRSRKILARKNIPWVHPLTPKLVIVSKGI